MLEGEIEQQDFAVVQDVDAFIASNLNNVPLNPNARFKIHPFQTMEHVIRRNELGTIYIDDKAVLVKDIPHTILFSNDSGSVVKGHIVFPKLYNPKNGKNQFMKNIEQKIFYEKIFMKAASEVCDPSLLSRISKSYQHAMSRRTNYSGLDFMQGRDIINIFNKMQNNLDDLEVDDELFCFTGFFICITAFGIKERYTGDIKSILSTIIDWNEIDENNVYVDFATNLFNKSKPSIIFALKSKMLEIGEVYGVDRKDRPVFHPHVLSGFGGFGVNPKVSTNAIKPKKLICYSDVKNPFASGKGFDYKTGYHGRYWSPQDLWNDNTVSAANINSVNVSKTE
jgi:hypothetical protein